MSGNKINTVLGHLRYRAQRAQADSKDADLSPQARSYLRGVHAQAIELEKQITVRCRGLDTEGVLCMDRLDWLAADYEHQAHVLAGVLRRELEAPCDLSEYFMHAQEGRISVYAAAARELRFVISEWDEAQRRLYSGRE